VIMKLERRVRISLQEDGMTGLIVIDITAALEETKVLVYGIVVLERGKISDWTKLEMIDKIEDD